MSGREIADHQNEGYLDPLGRVAFQIATFEGDNNAIDSRH